MQFHTRHRPEQVHPSAFIAPTAVVVGDVTLGEQSSVWFQAVLRGDTERIVVGPRSNVQDGAVLHADPGFACLVGQEVTVGHRAIVHGATIEDGVVVGMGAIVMNGARVGTGSLIAAGAVVPEGTTIPPASLAVGIPARVVRTLSEAETAHHRQTAARYVAGAEAFRLSAG